ncbi:methyltransferase [Ascodesmis nigricans]|uniref:Methyltransferase n=1 Tax=Ascodesmis nigricans TaxID=341454 RepID=A0A4S2N2S3_9PEZI|nr:methyltransferase [Ascodesmis nigricans]
MSRPEDTLPPDLFYNDTEALKYTTSSRIQAIQSSMTHRCLELLSLPGPSLILDIGCGSGLSGEILDSYNHTWIGMDISPSMLGVALDRETTGDLLLADMGQGIPFRAGSFDAAVSVSAVQWLCNAETSDVTPQGRLSRFFEGLYASIKRGGKAVLQFYPKNDAQRQMITAAAVKAGFGAGMLEDDPGTKNAKLYLVLTVGSGGDLSGRDITDAVKGMEGVDIVDERRRGIEKKRGETAKEWVKRKKDRDRKKGKIVKSDSKYTARKRRIQF